MFSKTLFLPRPDLAKQVLQAIGEHALTVVAAPMGYGKTTLYRTIVEALETNVWFYSVPAGRHEAPFLWHDMIGFFERQGLSAAAELRRLGFPSTPSRFGQALDILRTLTTPACFIFDDYHHVTDPAVHDFWEKIVRAAIPGIHVVLFSRVRPDMNVEELRIKGLAAIFDQKLLAFSREETEAYYRLHKVRNFAQAADESQCYSEGWPAALWLCLQSWKACGRVIPSPDIEALLADTVFSAYDADEQTCLMRLSVMENFTEGDAQRLSSVPRLLARLRTFRERNAFLSYDAKTGRYQFHSIFRDFLHKELAAAEHIDKPPLYREAGECCLERGERMSALRHLLRAGRVDDCARLLDIFLLPGYPRDVAYSYEEIFAAVSSLPWEACLQNPLGYLSFIANSLSACNDLRAVALLNEAEERFLSTPVFPHSLRKRVQGELMVIRGLMSFSDLRSIEGIYTEAWLLLRGPSVLHSMDPVWNYGSPCGSFLAVNKAGEYADIAKTVEQVWAVYVRLSDGIGKGAGTVVEAERLLEQGNFAEAVAMLERILPAEGDLKQMASALTASFGLARYHMASGKGEEAVSMLERLRSDVERADILDFFDCLDLALGYVFACLGRLDSIPQWLRDGEIDDPAHSWAPFVFGFSLTVYGRALLLKGEYKELENVALRIPGSTEPLESLLGTIHSNVLLAIATWRTRGRTAGLPHLRKALELSRPDGIVLSLAEYGGHIVPLLRQLKRTGYDDDEHLKKVLTQAERMARLTDYPGRKHTDGLLTPREQEFMQCVVSGMSNPAIAKSRGVAEVTVVKALSHAYVKLGAANRAEAARRFVELYGKAFDHSA